jgi:hypothetical protein
LIGREEAQKAQEILFIFLCLCAFLRQKIFLLAKISLGRTSIVKLKEDSYEDQRFSRQD